MWKKWFDLVEWILSHAYGYHFIENVGCPTFYGFKWWNNVNNFFMVRHPMSSNILGNGQPTHQDDEIVLEEKPKNHLICCLSIFHFWPQCLPTLGNRLYTLIPVSLDLELWSISQYHTPHDLGILKFWNAKMFWGGFHTYAKRIDQSIPIFITKIESVEAACFGLVPSESKTVFSEIQFLTSSCPHSASFALNWMRKHQKVLHIRPKRQIAAHERI